MAGACPFGNGHLVKNQVTTADCNGQAAIALSVAGTPSGTDGPAMIYAEATLRSALGAVVEAARVSARFCETGR